MWHIAMKVSRNENYSICAQMMWGKSFFPQQILGGLLRNAFLLSNSAINFCKIFIRSI